MKKHVRAALEARNLTGCEEWPCEICGKLKILRGMQVHHIIPRGMGGRSNADIPENLIICCHVCHAEAHKGSPSQDILLEQVGKILKITGERTDHE
jgi:5-methylcytosine-specific restriction endonuclease McrA